jgi:UDP-N-acetyl-D-mannosaminuronic acid transferase (WecB/TagA/CpsF family)
MVTAALQAQAAAAADPQYWEHSNAFAKDGKKSAEEEEEEQKELRASCHHCCRVAALGQEAQGRLIVLQAQQQPHEHREAHVWRGAGCAAALPSSTAQHPPAWMRECIQTAGMPGIRPL